VKARLVALVLGCTLLGVAVGARSVARSRAEPAPAGALRVPRARGPITIDGEVGDLGWLRAAARTSAFAPSRPYSDARFVAGADASDPTLYVTLYAADRDVRVAPRAAPDGPLWLDGDEFRLVLVTAAGEQVLEVAPNGVLTDARRAPAPDARLDYAWQSGARVAHDVDGTLDDGRDEDEEWVIEMAIPLASLGLTGAEGDWIRASLRRCDAERSGARTCGVWEGLLVFDGS